MLTLGKFTVHQEGSYIWGALLGSQDVESIFCVCGIWYFAVTYFINIAYNINTSGLICYAIQHAAQVQAECEESTYRYNIKTTDRWIE